MYDPSSEKFRDSLVVKKLNTEYLQALLALTFIHIITGNFISLFTDILVYLSVYNFFIVRYEIICTDTRLLFNNNLRPRLKILAIVFLVISLTVNLLYPIYERPYEYSSIFYLFFVSERVAGILNSLYLLFLSQIGVQIYAISTVGSTLISVWTISAIANERQWNLSVNMEKISDGVFSNRKKFSSSRGLLVGSSIFTGFILLTALSRLLPPAIRAILFTTMVIIGFSFRDDRSLEVNLFGRKGRQIINSFSVPKTELSRFQKVIVEVFKTKGISVSRRDLPYALIPRELTSIHQVGRGSVFKKGAKLGLYIGGIFYATILTRLFLLLFETKSELVREITVVLFVTVFWYGLLWIGINNSIELSNSRFRREQFFIGDEFVAYFKKETVWMMKNSMITGVRLKRGALGRFNNLFRYNKLEGLKLRWMTIITIFFALFSMIVIVQWVRFGALNLQGLVLLLGYYIVRSLVQADRFIGTEGGLTILIGAIVWILIVMIVPRIMIVSRRKFVIDLNTVTAFEFIVSDTADILEIYYEIEENILDKSIESPFRYRSRPGTFICDIEVMVQGETGEPMELIIGSSSIKKTLGSGITKFQIKQSGTKGVAEIPFEIRLGKRREVGELVVDRNTARSVQVQIGGIGISVSAEIITYRN